MIKVIKKDSRCVDYDFNKIIEAVKKSADRINIKLNEKDFDNLQREITKAIEEYKKTIPDQEALTISVNKIHKFVELALDEVNPKVAKAYREYRNYKKDYADMVQKVLKTADELQLKEDRSNANTNATLVSTKRALLYSALSKEIYKKTFLNKEELNAITEGYIYIHDLGARLDSHNCCLFDIGKVLQGGFEWEHIEYNEPKTLRAAGAVISDIVLATASQQYGGFTLPEIDSVLAPYAKKTYKLAIKEYEKMVTNCNGVYDAVKADEYAIKQVTREAEQLFQAFEHTFNSVSSSRGDFVFTCFTGGADEDKFAALMWSICMKVRKQGQGKPGYKRPAIFPKLVFLYTDKLHGEGKPMEWLFNEGIECSAKAMYPDFLSLDKPDAAIVKTPTEELSSPISEVFHKYHKFGITRWFLDDKNEIQENPNWVDSIISPMGCRAFLSPWYERGGQTPIDEFDKPKFHQRYNGGAVSLNLPMIFMKAKDDKKDFYEVLEYYLDMIDNIHSKTRIYLGKLKAKSNPLAFTQGGFAKLGMNDDVEETLASVTFGYGFTALHELQELYNKESLYVAKDELHNFAYDVEKYIAQYVINRKKDYAEGKVNYLSAIYATPAESLCGTQLEQFRDKYGVIKNVSDKEYFTNSFHMHVSEDITPFEKQDSEFKYFNLTTGGRIQYCKYASGDNLEYMRQVIRRAMKLGYYEGVNLNNNYCDKCGSSFQSDSDVCPVCNTNEHTTTVARVCGYLGYSKVDGTTKMNKHKMCEVHDRVSM